MASSVQSGSDFTTMEDMSSFASLLRTFLPDHQDLPLTESPEQLLQHVGHGLGPQQSLQHVGHGLGPQQSLQDSGISKVSPPAKCHNPPEVQGSKEEEKSRDRGSLKVKAPTVNGEAVVDDKEAKKDPDWVPGTDDEDYESDDTVELTAEDLVKFSASKTANSFGDEDASLSQVPRFIPSKQFVCFVCDEVFSELELYKNHMVSHCKESADIRCSVCFDSFTSKSSFNTHRRLAPYELWVDKKMQQQAAATESGIDSSSSAPGDLRGKYICNVCGRPLTKLTSFCHHVKMHGTHAPFTCAVCTSSFTSACLLRHHIDTQHTRMLPFQCRKCLRRFKLKCSLSTHQRHCQVDPDSLKYSEEMQFIDQLSQQRKFQGATGEEDGLSQYSCPICMLMFDSPEELQVHMAYHDEVKPFKCQQCGQGFLSKTAVQRHQVLHENKNEDCRCEICGVQLLTRSGYNAHLRGHRNLEMYQAEASAGKSEGSSVEPASVILDKIRAVKTVKMEVVSDGEGGGAVSLGTKPKAMPRRKYPCPICGMMFFTGGEKFQQHARKEHKDAQFVQCEICNKKFLGQANLDRHARIHKLYSQTFPCEVCGRIFRRKFALEVHRKLHSFKKFVKCDICGQEFRFVSEVEKHKHTEHKYERKLDIYKCNICGQKFPMLSHLSVHCYCHNMPESKPFGCDLCKVSFKTSTELKQHIYHKHDDITKEDKNSMDFPVEGITIPGFDGIIIKQEPLDEDDVEGEENMANTGGNSKNDSKSAITSNGSCVTSKHSSLPGTSTASLMSAKILSGMTATSANNLPGSMATVQTGGNTATKMKMVPEVADDDSGTQHNDVDAYNWATRQNMLQSRFLKRFSCDVCQKAFSSKSDLKTHLRIHSGETPFKCEFCDRSFKQRGHRKLHIQVAHTKEMPYKCAECDSAFPTRYRYQIHVKRHSGVREHKCAYCHKEYYTLGKLNEHKKRNHKEEWEGEQMKKKGQS